MAIASQLPHRILFALRRLLHLFKPLRGVIPRALRRILARLAFIWSILGTKLGFRQKGIGKPPSSSQDDESRITKAPEDRIRSEHTEQAEISRSESGSTSYTLIEQGEVISFDDVAFSAYPFPGNIRATRSTNSLANSHRSAHNLTTTVNNASRSSQHVGSKHSYHSGNSNYSGSVYSRGRTTATPYLHQTSREFPGWQKSTPTQPTATPHRKRTMSTPNLEVISPMDDMSPTGNGEVDSLRIPPTGLFPKDDMSPTGNGEVDSLRIPATRSSLIDDMSPTRNGEVDSLRIPTRSATPMVMSLDEPRISPRMPEDFAKRRYEERPRM
jgi:hypothetical protein